MTTAGAKVLAILSGEVIFVARTSKTTSATSAIQTRKAPTLW